MAQPTRSDDQAVRRRLSHNNLRRKQWRRRLPRAERKRPRRSGNSAALTFGVLVEHPIFLSRDSEAVSSCCSLLVHPAAGVSPRSEVAETPGRRARRQSAPARRAIPQSTSEGRNPQWRRRLRAERRRRRRRGKFADSRKRGRFRVPFFFGFWVLGFGIWYLPKGSSVPDLNP